MQNLLRIRDFEYTAINGTLDYKRKPVTVTVDNRIIARSMITHNEAGPSVIELKVICKTPKAFFGS